VEPLDSGGPHLLLAEQQARDQDDVTGCELRDVLEALFEQELLGLGQPGLGAVALGLDFPDHVDQVVQPAAHLFLQRKSIWTKRGPHCSFL
jgi:hypothetical protein